MAAALVRAGFAVTGTDADEAGIEIARSICPEAEFSVGTFAEPHPGAFDLVISTEVIEHLYEPKELIAYAAKALAPTGYLIISTPYHGYWKNLALSIAGKWDHHHGVDWAGGHIKFFSRRTLTALLESQGFIVTDFIGVGRFPRLWKSMVLVARRPAKLRDDTK